MKPAAWHAMHARLKRMLSVHLKPSMHRVLHALGHVLDHACMNAPMALDQRPRGLSLLPLLLLGAAALLLRRRLPSAGSQAGHRPG